MAKAAIERALRQKELPDDEKSKHSVVNYEHPAKGRNHCGNCAHFINAHIPRCETVMNPIRPGDWCKRWERD
jgi:hypothetical protein